MRSISLPTPHFTTFVPQSVYIWIYLSNGHQWASAFSSKKLSHTNAPTAHMFDIHSALHHRCANIDAYIDRASPQKTGESISAYIIQTQLL